MALTPTVNDFAADGFGKIPEVKYVYTVQHDYAFYVKVVVDDDRDKGVRNCIYAKELELINEFKTLDFDFDILTTELADPSFRLAYEKTQASQIEFP